MPFKILTAGGGMVPDLQSLHSEKPVENFAGLGFAPAVVQLFFFRLPKLVLHSLDNSSWLQKRESEQPRMPADSLSAQERTFYDVLGLPASDAQLSLREIKAAYHRALLTTHPDKVLGASGAEVDLVKEAFRVLSDDALRKEYDAKIKSKSPRQGQKF
jgi:hypothetical protein